MLLDNAADTDLHAAAKMEKAVRRDCHKMKAFVRFREVTTVGQSRRFFAAWFEPDHNIVEDTAPFFARRFADMDWLIATPKGTASFIGGNLKVTDDVLPIRFE